MLAEVPCLVLFLCTMIDAVMNFSGFSNVLNWSQTKEQGKDNKARFINRGPALTRGLDIS